MKILIILLLIILNGFFALAEIAIVSSRKSRLRQLASDGIAGAQAAFDLSMAPNRLLSTTQFGITLISIAAGAYGGATYSEDVASYFRTIFFLRPYASPLAFGLVVGVITYLSLILGELVPKRIGLGRPEKLAIRVAPTMALMSRVASPIIHFLSASTEFILKILGIKHEDAVGVSEEEVKHLIKEGARTGVFEIVERDIVERTLRLGDKKINALMTPRSEIVWFDLENKFKEIQKKITKNTYSFFPVCDKSLDRVVGMVHTQDFLLHLLKDEKLELKELLLKPHLIPENTQALNALELFKKSGIHTALIVDEYGAVVGLITLTDVLEAIVGDIPAYDEPIERPFIKRRDGSVYVDGLVTVDEFKEYFILKLLPGEKSGGFDTIGGFMMNRLNRIPVTGDIFEFDDFKIEVVDMDDNRVDKILVTKKRPTN